MFIAASDTLLTGSLALARQFERAGRLRDAQAVYSEVLTKASTSLRVYGQQSVARVLSRSEREWPGWLPKWMQVVLYEVRRSATVQALLVVLVLTVTIRWGLNARSQARSQVELVAFARQLPPSTQTAIELVIADSYERLTALLGPLVLQPTFARLPVLVRDPGGVVMELVDSSARQPLLKVLLRWLVHQFTRPRFRFVGHVEGTLYELRIVGQLHDGTDLVHEVTRLVPARSVRNAEQEVAYELLLALMERSD